MFGWRRGDIPFLACSNSGSDIVMLCILGTERRCEVMEIDTVEESQVDGEKRQERVSGIYNCSRRKLDSSLGLR